MGANVVGEVVGLYVYPNGVGDREVGSGVVGAIVGADVVGGPGVGACVVGGSDCVG